MKTPFNSQVIGLRSLNLKKDLTTLYQWVHAPHAKTFWDLEIPIDELKDFYGSVLQNQDTHSFIGMLNHRRVCQIDCYRTHTDELGRHIQTQVNDAGIHFLMAPAEQRIPLLSRQLLLLFMRYYFSIETSGDLYAEPDIYNHKACQLLKNSGFRFIQNVILSSKAASVYVMTRNDFYAKNPTL